MDNDLVAGELEPEQYLADYASGPRGRQGQKQRG